MGGAGSDPGSRESPVELIWLALAGGYIYSVVVCFQKGKKVFGWLGIGAIILPLAPLLIWFPLTGSLRRAKPDSTWAEESAPTAPLPPMGIASTFGAESHPSEPVGDAESALIVRAFLQRAARAGTVTDDVRDRLLDFLEEPEIDTRHEISGTRVAAFPSEPEVATTKPELGPLAPLPPRRAPVRPLPAVPKPSRTPAAERHPSRMVVHARKAWDEVSSEMAVHGLAYLGVLLTFVGVLGFLLFAFQDVPNQQQPVVELFIAVVFFGWSWVLRRQQAGNVANAMELLGGMILPLIVFAGLVDDAPFPPDFTGGPLVAMLTLSSLILAYLYAIAARRRPATTLRFLVLPLVWLGTMAFGFAFKADEALEGLAITRLVAIQPAVAAVAVALSVTPAVRLRLAERSIPVVAPATVAAPLLYVLAVALGVGRPGLMSLAASLAGLATIVSLHLLADHFDQLRWARLATPVLMAGAILPVAPQSGVGWAGLVGVGAYLTLLEWWTRHSPEDQMVWLLSGTGLVAALGVSLLEPWAAVAGFGVTLVWAHWRRVTGLPILFDDLELVLIAGTVLTPFGFGWALWNVLDPDVALLLMAALLATVTVTTRPRASDDVFWSVWPAAFALVVGGVVVSRILTTSLTSGVSSDLLPTVTLLVVAAIIAAGRDWFEPRFWLSSAILATDLFFVLDGSSASPTVRGVTWAGLGVALVGTSLLRQHVRWDHPAAVGHILGTTALWVAAGPGATAAILWLWAIGWLLSLAATDHGRGSVTRLLERTLSDRRVGLPPSIAGASTWMAPILFVVSVPIAMLASLNLWDLFVTNRSWTGVSLASLAVLFAGSTRMISRTVPSRRVLSYGAVTTVVLGVAIAAPVPWPTILAAGASIAVALTLASDIRHATASWFAWTMSGVLITLLAERLGVEPHHLYLVVLTWGVAAFAGGLIADDAIAGRRASGEGLRVEWTRFPVLLGALAVPAALGPNFALGSSTAIWSALGAAAGYGAVSWLLKSPLPTLPAYALGTFGIVLLLPVSVTEEPAWLTLMAALLLVAHLIARTTGREKPFDIWSAWDLPPLLVAHGVGMLALALAAPDMQPGPWILVGGLSAIVAISRRNRVWLDVGHVLVLVGVSFVSLGALAAALALTSGRAFVEAYRAQGWHRLASHIVAVLTAATAWGLLTVWAEWDLARTVSNTALVAGAGGLVGALLARLGLIQRDSAIAWSVWATFGVGIATLAGLVGEQLGESTAVSDPGLAFGLALLAAAAHLIGGVLGKSIRLAAIPMAGLAWLALLSAMSWSTETVIALTALAGGVSSLVAVEWHRRSAPTSDEDSLTIGWAGLGLLFVSLAALVALNLEPKQVWASAIAPGMGLAALAAARGAARLPIGGLRESSTVGLLASLTALAYGLGGSGGHLVAVALCGAVVGSALLVRIGPDSSAAWMRPIEWLVVAATIEAFAISLAMAPAKGAITAVLLTVGVQSALVGLARRQPGLVALSPPLLAAAAVLLITDVASGSVQWYTLPLALVVLAEVEIVRILWPDPKPGPTDSIELVEWVGIGLAVLPAAVEIFVRSLAAAGILLLVSAGLLLWAIVTRLRRRAIAGAGVAAGSSVLVVSAALAGQAPESAVLWIVAAGLGFSVMAIAGVVEAGQSRRGRVVGKLDELMGGWQ